MTHIISPYKRTYRQTIKGSLSFSSAGIHSGKIATMSLHPASAGTGVVFVRTDIVSQPIKVQYHSVVDTQFSTKIGDSNGNTINTIEHIMSTLFACQIDDVEIHLNSEEVPIMDGSSKSYTDRLLAVQTQKNDKKLQYIKILKPVTVNKGDSSITLSPYDGFIIDAKVNFDRGGIGTQKMVFNADTDCYKESIAPARTFGFESDIKTLHKMGLALGGGTHNAVVYKNTGTNQELRLKNECIAHKILDILGDLYVAGNPFLCKVDAVCMGHEINNSILHVLFSDPSNFEFV